MGEDAFEVMEDAEQESSEVYSKIRAAAEWFHEREGEMFEREEAEEKLQKKLDIEEDLASELVSELVSDAVDPVIQVNNSKGSFVGVAEYREFEGSYGFIDYDDVQGKRKKVVCAQCVKEAVKDTEVAHSTGDIRTEYEELVEEVHDHYSVNHHKPPETVKTGATLAAGTTVGGNRVATRNWVNSSHSSDSNAHHSRDHDNADHLTKMIEDAIGNSYSPYEIQKNGSDGNGIINFKT